MLRHALISFTVATHPCKRPFPVIPYTRHDLDDADVAAVAAVLRGDWLTQGPAIAEFERKVAERVGARHVIAVANGTAALHLACLAAGIGPGDTVVTSPITFAASGNCALYCGAEVRFADIRPDTYCMDPARLEAALTPATKAVIPVDFTGQPCDMDEIMAIATARGLTVIEDAAHSLGATYKGRKVGQLAHMTTFSFHPAKHVAMGEGGAIATDDDALARRLRLLRTHGITNADADMMLPEQAADGDAAQGRAGWYYEMQALGYNYRVSDMQCALGLSQLAKLDASLARRREIAARYTAAFAPSPLLLPPHQLEDRQNAWHLYMLRLRLDRMSKTRRQVFDQLRAQGIGVHVHYIPLHLQPYYRQHCNTKPGDFPQAEAYYASALTLPMYASLTDADCDRVIAAVLQTVS